MALSTADGFSSNEPATRRTHRSLVSPPGSSPTTSGSAIRVDTSRFPLVILELSANPTPADHRALFDACNRLAARGERLAYVVDMRKVNPFSLSASARKDAAAMYAEKLDSRRKVTICEARVIEHPLIRGIAVAFDWIVGHNWPTATFAGFAAAEEWALARIRCDKRP